MKLKMTNLECQRVNLLLCAAIICASSKLRGELRTDILQFLHGLAGKWGASLIFRTVKPRSILAVPTNPVQGTNALGMGDCLPAIISAACKTGECSKT